jgi:hypothetical protein
LSGSTGRPEGRDFAARHGQKGGHWYGAPPSVGKPKFPADLPFFTLGIFRIRTMLEICI